MRNAATARKEREDIRADRLEAVELATREMTSLRTRAVHKRALGVFGRQVDVWFESEQVAHVFGARYESTESTDRVCNEIFVGTVNGLPVIAVAGGAQLCWPHSNLSSAALAFLTDAVVTDALLSALPETVTLHAAALCTQGLAFAIAGGSTTGKTTTALACVAAGCEIYSDERCIITPVGVVPYPRNVNIRSGSLSLLRLALDDHPVRMRFRQHTGLAWPNAKLSDIGATTAARAPLKAIFAIVGRSSEPSINQVSASEILDVVTCGAQLRTHGIERICELYGTLSKVRCYSLVLGSPTATARAILARMHGAR